MLADCGRYEVKGLHQRGSIQCYAHLGTECSGSNPGFVTYLQYNLGKGYMTPLSLGFLANKMEEDSTYIIGSLKSKWYNGEMISMWSALLPFSVWPGMLKEAQKQELEGWASPSFSLPLSFLICNMWIIMPGLPVQPFNRQIQMGMWPKKLGN